MHYGPNSDTAGAIVLRSDFVVQGADPDLRMPAAAEGCPSIEAAAAAMLDAHREVETYATVHHVNPREIVVCERVVPTGGDLARFPLPTGLGEPTCTVTGRQAVCRAATLEAEVTVVVGLDLNGQPFNAEPPLVTPRPARCPAPEPALDALLEAQPGARGLALWSVCVGRDALATLDGALPDRTFGASGPLTRDGMCWSPWPGRSPTACLIASPADAPGQQHRLVAWFEPDTGQLQQVTVEDPTLFANSQPGSP